MNNLRQDIKASFARHQEGLGNISKTQAQLVRRALAIGSAPRRRLLPQLAAAIATFLLAGLLAVGVLLSRGHLRQAPQQPQTLEQAMSAGPAAVMAVAPGRGAYIWFTGAIVPTPTPSNGSYPVVGTKVEVLDWTGKVRYHFELPKTTAPVPNSIQTISADGTRALLDDGTVLDQTGAVVGRIPALRSNGSEAVAHWMSDDSGVCAAFSNEPVAPFVTPPPKGQPNPSPTAPPPYTLPGADHSVTLKVFTLDGKVRTVATVGREPLNVGSGNFGDRASAVACSPSTDLAIVARYHDADTHPGDQGSTNMTVSVWTIKLSTGAVLFHQPETRMALGRAFYYGSQNGKLAVEFLWNSQYWGSEIDRVLQMPSGNQVPVLDEEPMMDTPGLSADGTRILRRVIDKTHSHTALELIDASSGRVIRRVEAPGIFGATAVAQPGGSGFIVQVQRYLAFVDGNGGITLLHPDFPVVEAGPGGLALPGMPGLQS